MEESDILEIMGAEEVRKKQSKWSRRCEWEITTFFFLFS